MKLTPAIQNEIHVQSESEAQAQSLNLTQIFKKMKPFPEEIIRPALMVSLDLGKSSWHAVFMSGQKTTFRTFRGKGKIDSLHASIHAKMHALGLSETRDVVVCHEIGRDGWWISEWLEAHGIACVVMSADVLCDAGRHTKTDYVDARLLAVRLGRFFDGWLESDHVVLRPPADIREGRSLSRRRASAIELRLMFINKFKSILSLAGEDTDAAIGTVDVKSLRDALGRPLDTETLATLADLQRFYREADRIVKECDQLMKRHVEQIRRKAKEATPLSRRESMLLRLTRMKSIGFRTAWLLVHELFWKQFANVRGVGSASGLAAVPFSSGLTDKCAGISRRSNGRLRASLVELAWLWVRHQPGSALTHWFRERTDAGISRRRMKKVAIVAVARKLAVALWKFLERDEAIEGARLKTA